MSLSKHDPSDFNSHFFCSVFFSQCVYYYICVIWPLFRKNDNHHHSEKKNILMYNSFYLLYVESKKKNRRNKKEEKKKEAPYLLNKTPTTNWFLSLSLSLSITLSHTSTTTTLPKNQPNRRLHKLSYQFALGDKKNTRNSQSKKSPCGLLSAYEKMIHKRCDDYICT